MHTHTHTHTHTLPPNHNEQRIPVDTPICLQQKNPTRELINAPKTSHEHTNKDLNHLQYLSPGTRVDTGYIKSTRGTHERAEQEELTGGSGDVREVLPLAVPRVHVQLTEEPQPGPLQREAQPRGHPVPTVHRPHPESQRDTQ